MTVQELIDQLMSVTDKTIKVVVSIESGRSCFSTCDDVDGWEEDVESEDDNQETIFIIGGTETSSEY